MNSRKAKRIRKEVYGDYDSSPKSRLYRQNTLTGEIDTGVIRQTYQDVKKENHSTESSVQASPKVKARIKKRINNPIQYPLPHLRRDQ